jgi:hypothetical protein
VSTLETNLYNQITALRLPTPEREYRFAAIHVGMGRGIRERLEQHGLKDWRMDFAWPGLKFAVECEGGGWSGGRHTRGVGFAGDMQKYHHAMRLGWDVYRCDGALVKNGDAAQLISDIVSMRLAMLSERIA